MIDTTASMWSMSVYYYVALAVLASIAVYQLLSRYQFNRKYKLPPRIPGVPLLGNLHQIPPLQQGLWGQEMAAKYGELYESPLPDALSGLLTVPTGLHASSEAIHGSS
jgi:hypothetical protein